LHTGAIIGIVLGVVILVAIAIYLLLYKRKQHMNPSGKTRRVATDPGLQPNKRASELSEQCGKAELPAEHNIQSQIPPIEAQYHSKEARQSVDSVSGGTTVSVEEGEGVLVFHGRVGRNSV
jgi:hypothetical protein